MHPGQYPIAPRLQRQVELFAHGRRLGHRQSHILTEIGRMGTGEPHPSNAIHLADPARGLRNMARMVADGGLLLVYDMRSSWCWTLLPVGGGFGKRPGGTLRKDEVEAMLREAGIEHFDVRHEFPLMLSATVRK